MDTVIYQNKALKLMQEPYIAGTDDDAYYTAVAKDKQSREYIVRWEIINLDDMDESNACDWSQYAVVKA